MKLHFLIPLLSIALIDDAGKAYGYLKVEGIDLNFDPEEALKNLPDACKPSSTPTPAASEAKSETSTDEILPGVPSFTNLDDLITFLENSPEKSGAFALKLNKSGKPDFDKILRDIAGTIRNPLHGVPAPRTK